MCLMCLEIMKERMTIPEARKALRELMSTEQRPEDMAHYRELARLDDDSLLEKAIEISKED